MHVIHYVYFYNLGHFYYVISIAIIYCNVYNVYLKCTLILNVFYLYSCIVLLVASFVML